MVDHERATFDGFDPYKLTGVRVTDRKLGHGSYATVLELEYMGLKCAGKKIHELLLEQGDASYTVRRFEEECRILSQVRHPNIVQFLGVHFQERVRAPILVMEFLPTNLTSCIEQYGILPKEISYSILHDVALGLCYLHSQTPSIIHRDLSSNNVLLTPNMTAKISDLGVARILNLTPLQVSRMTGTPGTPAYMPPEVMVANPKYNTSVDEFSYGIMIIHMFSGRWPEPQVGQTRIEGGKLIPVTEAERREVFLNAIEENHPLMDLIHMCINNDPQLRPHAGEIIRRVSQVASQFPASFANRLEMLRQIEADGEEKRALTKERQRKDRAVQQKESQISSLMEEARVKEKHKSEEIDRLMLAHSCEVEQLQLQFRKEKNALTKEGERKNEIILQKENQISSLRKDVQIEKEQKAIEIDKLKFSHSTEVEQLQLQLRDMKTLSQCTKAENEAEIVELNSKYHALETQMENKTKILLVEREQSARLLKEEKEQYEIQLRKEQGQHEIQLRKEKKQSEIQLAKEKEQNETLLAKEKELFAEEREANRKLMSNIQDLRSDLSRSKSEITMLQGTISRLQSDITVKDAAIQMKEAIIRRKDTELEAKSRALGKKDATIAAMSEQITKTRDYLATTKLQTLQSSITWKQCTNLPTRVTLIKTTVFNGKVYCGGGMTGGDTDCIIYCYDPSQDKWTTLPPLSVNYFSLGQVNGKLVAIGGEKKGTWIKTNDVYTYDEQSQKWKWTIPSMPTARDAPGVESFQSALIVAGGNNILSLTTAVEIFKPDTSQWYRTDPLPTACRDISVVAIGNICYALGGYNDFFDLNQALYASVDDLLGNAVPANQTTHSGSSDTPQSAWNTLPNTPTYGPAAAVLAGNLLAVGGSETPDRGAIIKKVVYMYSTSTNSWIYISDLPAPLACTVVAVLSSTEILVIGGTGDDGGRVNTVYKGTLSLL